MRMNEVVQYILAGIIVIAAVVAVVRSIICAARGCKTNLTACSGCKLQGICGKSGQRFNIK